MISIPRTILEELKRRAEERGLSLEEFLTEIGTQDLDPEDRAEKYIDVAMELINQAKEELMKNDLRQASKKIWGACALAIKAYALKKDKKVLTRHADLWRYKDRVIAELGEWVRDAWMYANAMHINFYEGEASRADVEKALKLVEDLVKTIMKNVHLADKPN